MTNQDDLVATISALIRRKAEGVHWDFKRQHQADKGTLIHDILCLANAQYSGDRFLIFGVGDEDFSLHSVDRDAGRRKQADVAALFRDHSDKFFESRFPEFHLEEISLDGQLIDVLVIKDLPFKPYYLVQRYKQIPAHQIFTRVCDTNTPIVHSAPPHEIERMWRERFGIDLTPLERAKRYLTDPDSWSTLIGSDGSNANFYHTQFPEFTLRVAPAADMDCRQEWTRGEIRNDDNHAGYYELYYHQTRLVRVHYVSFDHRKKSMVAPNWEARGTGRFYFYEADSIQYAVHQFYSRIFRQDDSTTLSIRGEGTAADEARQRWGHNLNIPVLHPGELERFLPLADNQRSLRKSGNEAEWYQLFVRNLLDFDDWRASRR